MTEGQGTGLLNHGHGKTCAGSIPAPAEEVVMKHEWITLKNPRGLKICYWCGVCKDTHEHTECKSKVKMVTKNKKLEIIYR